MHDPPGPPVGEFAFRPGLLYAAADQFEIDVIGKGHTVEVHHPEYDFYDKAIPMGCHLLG